MHIIVAKKYYGWMNTILPDKMYPFFYQILSLPDQQDEPFLK